MTSPKINGLFRNAGVYTLANILNSAIPFLLLPVFTRYLNPYDYGIIATFQVLVSFISPLIGLSLNGSIAVQYYDKNGIALPKYITNCIFILLAATIFTSIFLYIFSTSVSKLVSFPAGWLWSIVVICFGQFFVQVVLTLWQIQMKPLSYGIFQILLTILNLAVALFLVITLKMNWEGRIIAQVCCDGSFGIVALILLYKNRWLSFQFDKTSIKSALRYGVPLIPHAIAGWIMSGVDRVFINNMVGVAETGRYTVGYQIAMIILLLETSFNNAWVPWLFHNLSSGDSETKIKIVKITYFYVAIMVFLALMLSLFAPFIINVLVGKEFRGSLQYIFWAALGKGLYSMYLMTCNYIFYMNKTSLVALSTFTAAAIHVVATYYLIQNNGAIGAVQAGVISTFVLVFMTWYFANKVYKMPWNLSKSVNDVKL